MLFPPKKEYKETGGLNFYLGPKKKSSAIESAHFATLSKLENQSYLTGWFPSNSKDKPP